MKSELKKLLMLLLSALLFEAQAMAIEEPKYQIVPSEFTLETVPMPSNPLIAIREIPGQLMAVNRYSGRWTDENQRKQQAILTAALENAGIRPVGDMVSAAYNPPFMPPFLRRNEVMIPVSKAPGQ